MKIAVTGATGFVGQAFISYLLASKKESSYQITAIVRQVSDTFSEQVEQVQVKDLSIFSAINSSPPPLVMTTERGGGEEFLNNVKKKLNSVDVLIHTAARVHVMNDVVIDPLVEFRKINRDATLGLARFAAESGVKRFVFISSIKVNGEFTLPNFPFLPDDTYIPDDPYGLSKYEAEQGLLNIAKETGMEVVIIRPPLVYGSGVKANFASMIKWMGKSIPLPFGAIHNQRSLVALDNLVDFIALCADREKSPKAVNQIFLISDGEDVSTTQLLRKVAGVLNKKSWLIPVPVCFMVLVAKLVGKEDVANRLFGSLQVDSSKAGTLLGWKPVITMDEQLKKTAKAFLDEKNH
ncbi:UDP-glucose 4-epimerase [hydrothermal vent metagenome]|uniref:UDP-glucose 4-epimerase n=1 Tax=hydrothermal vent metagenome TaxID=652676 RepID=A0A3B0VZJ6_9ZZZZ